MQHTTRLSIRLDVGLADLQKICSFKSRDWRQREAGAAMKIDKGDNSLCELTLLLENLVKGLCACDLHRVVVVTVSMASMLSRGQHRSALVLPAIPVLSLHQIAAIEYLARI